MACLFFCYNLNMNKITIEKKEYNLIGDVIQPGINLDFFAQNLDGEKVRLSDINGRKIISVFPMITTSVCDLQTKKILELTKKYVDLTFISISMDTLEELKKWCIENDGLNSLIWSDLKFGDFGKKTNSLIKKINKLNRGFLLLDENNNVEEVSWNSELVDTPNFDIIANKI